MSRYQKKLEKIFNKKCGKIRKLIKSYCLSLAKNSENVCFFLKMIADFFRYQIEYKTLEEIKGINEPALRVDSKPVPDV